MSRRRSLILAIVTAGCWIVLLPIVLNSVYRASKLATQRWSKDTVNLPSRSAPALPKVNPLSFAREAVAGCRAGAEGEGEMTRCPLLRPRRAQTSRRMGTV